MSTWFVIDFRYLSFSWYFAGSVAMVRVKPRQFQVANRSKGKVTEVVQMPSNFKQSPAAELLDISGIDGVEHGIAATSTGAG
jgi:hypothetical protein